MNNKFVRKNVMEELQKGKTDPADIATAVGKPTSVDDIQEIQRNDQNTQ